MNIPHRILVTGFPYVRERYFATWRHVPDLQRYRFLLPERWSVKGGKIVFQAPEDERVFTTRTLFSHSRNPVIGGLLKGWMPFFPLRLWRLRKNIGLVYACSEPILLSTLYFSLFTKLLGKKLVLFSWENIPYEKKLRSVSRFVHALLLKMNLALADGLICGNPEGVDVHRRYTPDPIAVIPMNGLDPEIFKRRNDVREHSRLSSQIVYTFIGAIGYRKGIHLAIRALPDVLKQIPDAHMVIAGSGEYEKQIDQLISELGLNGHVTRFSWIDQNEIIRLLSVSSVFFYPSIPHGGWAEQFGYSMAEASLMELPVISTRSGSIAHVVRDGKTGLLIDPNDLDQLAGAMVSLGKGSDRRNVFGRNGRKFIISRYSHEAVALKLHDFLRSVAE